MKKHFWPDALREYFEGLLKGEDRLHVIAPWGLDLVSNVLRWHKVDPLARELHLSSTCPLPEFQTLFQAERIRQLFCDEIIQNQLQEIDNVFQQNNTKFIVLKGPLLAEQIYSSALCRHLGDIDLLIQPNALNAAINLLMKLGYVPHRGLALEDYLTQKGEVKFEYPEEIEKGRTTVELHWHPINADQPSAYHSRGRLSVASEDFFCELAPTPFRTFSLLLPRPEIWFGYQTVHGVCQHKLKQLLPLVDLAYIIRRYPQLDFDFLLELMRKWKALIPLFIGLKTLWLFGLREGPHLEILERLEKVMPWRARALMATVSPKIFLLAYSGKYRVNRWLVKLVSTMPLDVKA